MYKEIKNLPRHFLVEEASLGCSEKNEIFPPYGKIGIPRTEHRMETMQATEAPMAVRFNWEKEAPVLESFSALEMVKMFFYRRFFFYLTMFWCARVKHTSAHNCR
jgi:hypothetical protein